MHPNLNLYKFISIAAIFVYNLCSIKSEDCPSNMPIKVKNQCYGLHFTKMRFKEASDNCMNLGGQITSIRNPDLLKVIKEKVLKHIEEQLEKGNFWIGIKLDPENSALAAVEDRKWIVEYYETKFVQKEYSMWNEKGGPKDKGPSCTILKGSDDFNVHPMDCGSPRLPVICMMKKGKNCYDDNLPYLPYGPHCIAIPAYADVYNKVSPGCSPNAPSPIDDNEMKQWVAMAARNFFLGGGLFQNIQKFGNTYA